ncbi:hypothetical protein EOA64_00315 [Mesorhizobium sp. M1A.F.Ca.IN.022.02.1.1]|uniref:hypothetical protein n=1 Tax=Mesorhizobium sp. M1A.F.Ca.IN.022.02.1.1 TaxID=2496766 RepID=UPI000FC9F4F9|nr:hypothetical protein [Mesorhizobium sp. M1A.F.Ca.IN.022.02.1.1]RUV65823.1 hypothetical protein EOA64_00315 [Mesorhizobium sp. M1A.F.Ca.IN.022.02.1.1]RWI33425.1 MAG: hypothetical protein EOR13_17885 [Mesorhizobium sp.]
MREPWFQIIDVVEPRQGRPIADIAAEVAAECQIDIRVLRSPLTTDRVVAARDKALLRIFEERPDVPSGVIAAYFKREPSTIRHHWRRLGIHRSAA